MPAASRVWTRSYESAAVPVSRRDQNCRLVVARWSVGYSIHSSSRASSWFIPTRNALRGDGLRVIEVRTDRAAGAKLRARLREACVAAAAGA